MIELHQKLLGDRGRNEAFVRALEKVIQPGKTTISDIGSGTGFLSFLASKLGAQKCYLYESDPALIALSKKLAQENGTKNCVFIEGYSDEIKNPVKTDVVISETLGNFALEEHVIEIVRDATRFLKLGGIHIPFRIEQWVAPVTSPRIQKSIDTWNVGFELNLRTARDAALNNMYVAQAMPKDLAKNAAQRWDDIKLDHKTKSERTGRVRWKLPTRETVYGFTLWWTAHLAAGISISTSPYEKRTHWDQIYLPLIEAIQIKPKDTLELELHSDTRYEIGIRLTWTARTKNKTVSMDTKMGIQ